eukprot:gnl/Hemi2/10012_TR3463_c0_g1_i2.p1 gnl/Hemi2/10012_TR3463_c0_g1~~gnl/Hemi2/10012_TR3463_c0_g1_i2.p1  ORF type:complete len:140 (+),score=28.72 gnl/Hemi2/10012_TR3463_c0_g1_i2:215-634(+)
MPLFPRDTNWYRKMVNHPAHPTWMANPPNNPTYMNTLSKADCVKQYNYVKFQCQMRVNQRDICWTTNDCLLFEGMLMNLTPTFFHNTDKFPFMYQLESTIQEQTTICPRLFVVENFCSLPGSDCASDPASKMCFLLDCA